MPSSTAARVACRASSTPAFAPFLPVSVAAPTLIPAPHPAPLARPPWPLPPQHFRLPSPAVAAHPAATAAAAAAAAAAASAILVRARAAIVSSVVLPVVLGRALLAALALPPLTAAAHLLLATTRATTM